MRWTASAREETAHERDRIRVLLREALLDRAHLRRRPRDADGQVPRLGGRGGPDEREHDDPHDEGAGDAEQHGEPPAGVRGSGRGHGDLRKENERSLKDYSERVFSLSCLVSPTPTGVPAATRSPLPRSAA